MHAKQTARIIPEGATRCLDGTYRNLEHVTPALRADLARVIGDVARECEKYAHLSGSRHDSSHEYLLRLQAEFGVPAYRLQMFIEGAHNALLPEHVAKLHQDYSECVAGLRAAVAFVEGR